MCQPCRRSAYDIHCGCECGNAIHVKLRCQDEKEYLWLSTVASLWLSEQTSLWDRMLARLKAAWYMLRGKEYELHELVVSKEEWQRFIDLVHEQSLIEQYTEE